MNDKLRRIAMIQDNLKENSRTFREGNRNRQTYLICKRDGEKRIAELRAGYYRDNPLGAPQSGQPEHGNETA